MVTEIDYKAIQDRIVAILKTDARLWDNKGAESGLIQVFYSGTPQNERHAKYACVFFQSDLDDATGSTVNNSISSSKHKMLFFLDVVANRKQDRQLIKDNDVLIYVKTIKEDLKSNYKLRDPADLNNSSTELVQSCHPHFTFMYRGRLPIPHSGVNGVLARTSIMMSASTS